jgi:hypothetical protein
MKHSRRWGAGSPGSTPIAVSGTARIRADSSTGSTPSDGLRCYGHGSHCWCRACSRRLSTPGRCSCPGKPPKTRTKSTGSSQRLDRQRIFERPRPLSLWAVIDEGVLRRRIGSTKVMHDQFVHLAEMDELVMIKAHVIPAEVGAHIGLLGAFVIADVAGDGPGILHFESPDEGQTT